MRNIIYITFLLLLTGCSLILPDFLSHPKEFMSHGSKINAVTYDYQMIELSYKSKSILDAEFKKEAELRKKPLISDSLHKGGIVLLTVYDTDIDTVNIDYWELIVETMDGREITRAYGQSNSVPDFREINETTFWYDIMSISVPEKIDSQFRVYAYDKLRQKRSEFIITPDNGV